MVQHCGDFVGYIDRMEGDVSSTDDEGLDAPVRTAKKAGEKRLQQDLESPATVPEVDDFDDVDSQPQSAATSVKATHNGHQIGWSSNDDDFGRQEYEDFKNRKRKRTAGIKVKPIKKNQYAPKNAIVGKKRPRGRLKKGETAKPYVYGMDSEDDDDDRIEAELPDYLKKRRAKFNDNRKKLGDAGLKIPPNFDDIDFSDDEHLAELEERPSFSKLNPCAEYKDITLPLSAGIIPAPISQWLREYQVKGTAFLHELFIYQKGGILGDDMGLGKTIQVIAFLTAAFGKTGDERDAKRMRKTRRQQSMPFYPRILIVCPGTLMDNWKTELDKWGWWHVDTCHGTAASKETALQSAKTGRLEIMITTYKTYQLNRDSINFVEWDCVIADECHTIKEPRSEISTAMAEVNALCRIGLTGTAIQNNYEDLWTLLNWTSPGRFGTLRSWKSAISEPLKLGQSHDATQQQLAKARSTAKKLVNNLLPQFFLRRMKSLIADQLPKKSDRVIFCPLTTRQQEAYENFLDSEKVTTIKESTNTCECGSGKKFGWCCGSRLSDGSDWKVHVFPCISTLQRLCSHLASIIPAANDDPAIQSKALENLEICCPDDWRELFQNRDSMKNFTNRDFCGKWRVLRKLLDFWYHNGDKVLIFSHSTKLLRMLYSLMSTTSYTIAYLDGSLSYAERTSAVNTFNASPHHFAFLISTRAGGTGLNITSANKVVVVDPNWNPAHDLQAQDRAYRIGQQRDVEVFRLVSAGTLEEIMYARQIYKQQQANIAYTASHERRYFKGVMDKKEMRGEIFGLQNMFTFHGDGGNVVLRDIVNATNVAESKAGVDIVGLDVDSFAETEDSQFDFDSPERKKRGRGGDDDDNAMSQLADLIASGEHDSQADPDRNSTTDPTKENGAKKGNAVAFILASAGVGYTHKNTDLLGSSRIEARLGRHAEEAAAKYGSASHPEALERKVFAPQSHSHSQNHGHSNSQAQPQGQERPNGRDAEVEKKFRPSKEVRRRQFCEMARMLGWVENGEVDVTGFAMAVEGWHSSVRRDCLERFYSMLGERTGANGVGVKEEDDDVKEENDEL